MSVDTKRLRELLAAATPGPWVSRNSEVMTETFDGILHGPARPENAALVAALRNEAPALLDELDRLCAEIEALPSYKRDLDIAEASLANTDAELDRLRNEPLRQQADALMRDLATRTKELDEMAALQERTRQVNIEQADELDRVPQIVAEGVARAKQERDDALAVMAEVEPELEQLRRLEAAVLELDDVIESEVCAFAPDDKLASAIAESRAAKEGDRG